MNNCIWKQIKGFQSLDEFHRFVEWMNDQIKAGVAQEVHVSNSYIGATTLREKWFRHSLSGQTWRLVWPDAPFAGVFEMIE